MSQSLPKNSESIFAAALSKPSGHDRLEYVRQAAAGNATLEKQVLELLQAHEKAKEFLEAPLAEVRLSSSEAAGDINEDSDKKHGSTAGTVDYVSADIGESEVIAGKYKLLQKIGEGGMGVVYLARQTEPVRREIALKIIAPGMDSRQVLARFEQERQALAVLDHPNIARVFDAGTTDRGQPFFVMELIKGVPITQFCDERKLSVRERLELFIPVCQAVQHAHQKGIIHRDIKPSNVLVSLYDDKPVPKVIDFGVAKATNQQLTERTLFTQHGAVVGTLEYMSPEQASFNAIDVDTRSDIYSLGVLLYELLTGSTPLEREQLKTIAFDEVLRMLRELEPPTPSRRISTTNQLASVAAQRRIEPRRLGTLVKGELDWIVMKCLEKDRSRRYESATGLASDVLRYLSDEPVVAGPPSTSYRLRKYITRHRGFATAIVAVFLTMAVGTFVSLAFALQASREAARAERESHLARESDDRARKQADRADREAKFALENERRAVFNERVARNDREKADRATSDARRNEYVATMNHVQRCWEKNDLSLMTRLLDRYTKQPEFEKDLRGFEWYFWNRQLSQSVHIFKGHESAINSMSLTSDGRWLASQSGGSLRVLDAETGSEERLLHHWDAVTMQESKSQYQDPREKKGQFSPTKNVCIQPGSLIVASTNGAKSNELQLWQGSTGERIQSPKFADPRTIYCLSFSPNGHCLATHSLFNGMQIWDFPSGRKLFELFGDARRQDQFGCLVASFSPDGKRIAMGTIGGGVVLWKLDKTPVATTLWGHQNTVSTVQFNPAGTRLVSGSRDGSIKLWNLDLSRCLLTLNGHSGVITSIAYSPDGTRFVSASEDRTACVWNARTGRKLRTIKGHHAALRSVLYSSDGNRIITGADDCTIRFWDANMLDIQSEQAPELDVLDFNSIPLSCLCANPDGTRFYLGRSDYGSNGDIESVESHTGLANGVFKGHKMDVKAINISSDGKFLASSSKDETVRIWNIGTRKCMHQLRDHKGVVNSVCFNDTGKLLASGGEDAMIRIWDRETGKLKSRWKEHAKPLTSVMFSPDGELLASASLDGTVRLWNVKENRLLRTCLGHERATSWVTFSPDGRILVSASHDSTIKLWDGRNGDLLKTIAAHSAEVTSVAFAPDGKRIASSSLDNTVKLWDAGTHLGILTLSGKTSRTHPTWTDGVCFSRDGSQLACLNWDGSLSIWHGELSPDSEVRRSAIKFVRNLYSYPKFRKEVTEEISNWRNVSPEVRKVALTFAETYEGNGSNLAAIVKDWCCFQTGTSDFRERTVSVAEECFRLKKADPESTRLLAFAHFRAGKSKVAAKLLATVTEETEDIELILLESMVWKSDGQIVKASARLSQAEAYDSIDGDDVVAIYQEAWTRIDGEAKLEKEKGKSIRREASKVARIEWNRAKPAGSNLDKEKISSMVRAAAARSHIDKLIGYSAEVREVAKQIVENYGVEKVEGDFLIP